MPQCTPSTKIKGERESASLERQEYLFLPLQIISYVNLSSRFPFFTCTIKSSLPGKVLQPRYTKNLKKKTLYSPNC
jgi:hypothetical protein